MFRCIEGYPGYYAKDNGEIWSVKSGAPRRIIPTLNHKGYERVKLYKNGKRKTITVHRLIAITFIPNPDNKPQVNHKDENKRNNRVDNSEWCTCLENIRHGTGVRRGTNSRKRYPIIQLDINGNFIKEWPSATDAGRELNIQASHVSNCCRGTRKTCGGYTWRYKNGT